ncbi:unnamed protein product, partial [Medioppia subpectinata]
MSFIDFASSLWTNFQNSSQLFPYLYKELDRKYNPNTKIRKLKESDADLETSLYGKVCIITGGSRGIGSEVVKVLLKKECHVITGSSSKSESEHIKRHDQLMADIPKGRGKLDIWHLDLKSMNSVSNFAKRFKQTGLPLNYFIANAGIMSQKNEKLTEDNFEGHLAVNYLSHCLLIDHFLDALHETAKTSRSESRIVLVSSAMHRVGTIKFNDPQLKATRATTYLAYGQSKLAQIMFANRMTRWLEETGNDWRQSITVNSLHPGICNTELLTHMPMVQELKPMAAQAFR